MPTLNVSLRVRSDTSSSWSTSNPILAMGEPGYIKDTEEFFIGNGSSTFENLQKFSAGKKVTSISLNGVTYSPENGVITLPDLYRYYGYNYNTNGSPNNMNEIGIYGGAYSGPTGWPNNYQNSNGMPAIFNVEVGHGIWNSSPDWLNMKTSMQICITKEGDLYCRYKIPQTTGDVDSWNWSSWATKSVNIIDSLTSTSTTSALSANQGKVLNDKIEAIPSISVINNLTSTSTTDALSAYQGNLLNNKMIKYGTCSTVASTVAKTVTISGFSLVSGALVVVKFSNGNSASSPTLNINSTGAKRIYRDGSSSDSLDLVSGEVVMLAYDGTYYRVIDIPDASTTRAGKVRLNNALTSTSTTEALTAAQGKALNDKISDIDFQTGSWTPVIKAGTAYTLTGSGTGRYVKIGPMVQIWGYFTPTSTQRYTSSASVVLEGLPFNASSLYFNNDLCFNVSGAIGNSVNDGSGFGIIVSGIEGDFWYRDGKGEFRKYNASHIISNSTVCSRIAFYGTYYTTE